MDLQAQIATARTAGYSDAEIAKYLSTTDLGPKIQVAQQAGYAPEEIVTHLANTPPAGFTGPVMITLPGHTVPGGNPEQRRQYIIAHPGVEQAQQKSEQQLAQPQSLGGVLANPATGLLSIPQQVMDWVKDPTEGGFGRGGELNENPVLDMYGNALMTMTPPEETVARGARGAMGAAKGAWEGFRSGRSSFPALAAGGIGDMLGGPHGAAYGVALGALPGTIEGMASGWNEALNPIESARPRVASPPLRWNPSPVEPKIVAPPPLRWNPSPVEPKIVAPPPLRGSSIPPVESPAPTVAPPPLRGHSYVEPKPPVRVTPPPLRGSSLPTPEPVAPAVVQAPTTAVPPVGGTPAPKETGMTAAEAHKYAHAQATEAELPGSPAGTSKGAHAELTRMAKEMYGKSSWHELSPKQMEAIGDRLLEQNRGSAASIPPVQ